MVPLATQPSRATTTAPSAAMPSIDELLAADPDSFVATYPDIAAVNLACAQGLPGADDLDVPECLALLDKMAAAVRARTQKSWRLFEVKPQEFHHSRNIFRVLTMEHVLRVQFGVKYDSMVASVTRAGQAWETSDSRQVFIHGILGPGRTGTCSSLPVFSIAVGRRCGYPLWLVRVPQHCLFRWDDGREKVNFQHTEAGTDIRPDEYYHGWPERWDAGMQALNARTKVWLHSMTPRQEISKFLCNRNLILQSAGRYREALEAILAAARYDPANPACAEIEFCTREKVADGFFGNAPLGLPELERRAPAFPRQLPRVAPKAAAGRRGGIFRTGAPISPDMPLGFNCDPKAFSQVEVAESACEPPAHPWKAAPKSQRGRFRSPDRFEGVASHPQTLHKYAYVHGDPVNTNDPTGMIAIAVSALNFADSFARFILDPGRRFTASWGFGRELSNALDYESADPFELAELHQLSQELQLMDLQAEVGRGMAQVFQSQQAMWETWWSAYDDFPVLGDPVDILLGFIGVQACFVAGTQVVVGVNDDGTYVTKPIEDLRENDLVLARDQHDATDDYDLRPVVQLFRKTSNHVRVVTIRDADGAEEVIRTTDDHPFWVEDCGWVGAGELRVGDRVNEADSSNNAVVIATSREVLFRNVTVYNFEVLGDHTYFVADGAGRADVAVWVHNVCGGARFYQDYVTSAYGPAQGRSVRTFQTPTGRLRRADHRVTINGVEHAIEAKHTQSWQHSPFNPRSIFAQQRPKVARLVRSNLIAQARDYTQSFGRVVYHTNSIEFIAHYKRIFAQRGLPMDKIVFVLTPGP